MWARMQVWKEIQTGYCWAFWDSGLCFGSALVASVPSRTGLRRVHQSSVSKSRRACKAGPPLLPCTLLPVRAQGPAGLLQNLRSLPFCKPGPPSPSTMSYLPKKEKKKKAFAARRHSRLDLPFISRMFTYCPSNRLHLPLFFPGTTGGFSGSCKCRSVS